MGTRQRDATTQVLPNHVFPSIVNPHPFSNGVVSAPALCFEALLQLSALLEQIEQPTLILKLLSKMMMPTSVSRDQSVRMRAIVQLVLLFRPSLL